MKKYELNPAQEVYVDVDYYGSGQRKYILSLPYGYKIRGENIHVKGYDTMDELKKEAINNVAPCDCGECAAYRD